MDRTMDYVSGPVLELQNVKDFGFIDFMDETNFQQFIELVRGEAEEVAAAAAQFCANWDCDHVVGLGCVAPTQFVSTPDDLRDFNLTGFYEFNSFPEPDHEDIDHKMEEQRNEGEKECSPTTTTTTTTAARPATPAPSTKRTKKADRSRTLISERKRRGRMKEKLYALRSLVPNITKMDKASIIGDAIRYVQELQMKTRKLKAEIAGLESSLNQPGSGTTSFQDPSRNISKITTMIPPPAIKKILQMEVFQVESREFYVRIECNKKQGIAALLYKALDSLGLYVQSSNLATAADNYLFTFTLNIVNEFEMDINLPNLKLWIATAFCDQGFHFVTLPSA